MISPQRLLRELHLRPRKQWGQNFLVREESAQKIARYSGVDRGDAVLEIGPGLGALTSALAELGCRVVAVEIDPKLAAILEAKWKNERWFRLIRADVLDLDIAGIAREEGSKLRVVSNLPYSVSTPILEHLAKARAVLADLTLLLQEDVIDRIAAEPGTKEYGRLTVGIQTLFEVKRGPRIPRGSFFPVPDVESRLLRLSPRETPLVPQDEIGEFFRFAGRLFQHRRKTLRNCLKSSLSAPRSAGRELTGTRIDLGRRPETLTIAELLELFETPRLVSLIFK